MKIVHSLLLVLLGFLVPAVPSHAIFIYNTGASSTASGSNFIDDHWTLTSFPTGYGYTSSTYLTNDKSGGFPLTTAYVHAPAGSAYISPKGGVDTLFAPGNYVYQEAFVSDFTGAVTVTGNFAADNSAVISLVGATLTASSGLTSTTFSSLQAFSLSFNAVSGTTYDFDVTVTNAKDGTGPGGGAESALLVSDITAVPEPSSWTMAICLFSGLLLFLRRFGFLSASVSA